MKLFLYDPYLKFVKVCLSLSKIVTNYRPFLICFLHVYKIVFLQDFHMKISFNCMKTTVHFYIHGTHLHKNSFDKDILFLPNISAKKQFLFSSVQINTIMHILADLVCC